MKWRLVLFLTTLLSLGAISQNPLGTWSFTNFKYSLNSRLSLFSEAQLRSLKLYTHFHYHEIKAGVTYEVRKTLNATFCLGKYDTYREGGDFVRPKNADEIRLWPQLTSTQQIGKLKVELRYRMELRFTTDGFRLRNRIRGGLIYELGKNKKGYKPIILQLNDELFLGTTTPYFERNRIQAAITFRLDRHSAIQVGFVHQNDFNIKDETGVDFFQLGFLFNLSGKNKPFSDVETRAD